MRAKNLFIFFIASCLSFSTLAQNENEQVQAYLDSGKALYVKYEIVDSIRPYARKAEKLAREINNKPLLLKSLTYIGASYMNNKKMDSTIYYWNKSLRIANELKNDTALADLNYKFGNLYLGKNDHKRAAKYFLNAIKQFGNLKQYAAQADCYLGLAVIYAALKDIEGREESITKCLTLSNKITDTTKRVMVLSQLASQFVDHAQVDQKWADTAETICQFILPLAKDKNLTQRVQSIYITLFKVYYIKRDARKMQFYSKEILQNKEQVSPNLLELLYLQLSNISFKDKKYANALNHIKSAEQYHNPNDLPRAVTTSIYKHRALRALGKNSDAYEALLLAYTLKDSLRTLDRYKTINELEEKYESELKQARIAKLEQNRIIQSIKINQRNWAIAILALLALIIIIVIWLFAERQKQKKNAQIIETKHKLLRSQMNPHFLFNGFTALQHSIMQDDNKIKSVTHLAEFSKLMRAVLESSFHEYVTLNKELSLLENYLKIQRFRFDNAIDYQIKVDPQINRNTTLIPPMLLQPFLENSIEHGLDPNKDKLNLQIEFTQTDKQLHLTVTDDGIGLVEKELRSEKHVSRAITIVRERLKLLDKLTVVKSSVEILNLEDADKSKSGVRVHIKLPLKVT